jgi:hypothetical protein
MLTQINHWLEIVDTAVDLVLLGRVLTLRLQKTYVYITLACVLSVMFDGVDLWLGTDSTPEVRVFLYSRFLYAVLYPLVAWDVFEEVKGQIVKLRRLATGRLISGLFFATMFCLLLAAFIDTGDANGQSTLGSTVGLVLWAGSSSASLAFLWTLQRGMRAQNVTVPRNTSVWLVYFELLLAAEVLSCFLLLIPPIKGTGGELVNLAYLLYGMAITVWCSIRLRPMPTSEEPASENART